MFGNTSLQTSVSLPFDFTTLPGTVILIVVSAVVLALAFLGIYFAYVTIGRSVAEKEQEDAAQVRQAAFAETQAIVKQAKTDMIEDFSAMLDLDKTMREKLFLTTLEEAALKAKNSST